LVLKVVSIKIVVSHALINTELKFGSPSSMHPRRKVLCTHECVLLAEEEKKRERGGRTEPP
jgi:hypothetical protein